MRPKMICYSNYLIIEYRSSRKTPLFLIRDQAAIMQLQDCINYRSVRSSQRDYLKSLNSATNVSSPINRKRERNLESSRRISSNQQNFLQPQFSSLFFLKFKANKFSDRPSKLTAISPTSIEQGFVVSRLKNLLAHTRTRVWYIRPDGPSVYVPKAQLAIREAGERGGRGRGLRGMARCANLNSQVGDASTIVSRAQSANYSCPTAMASYDASGAATPVFRGMRIHVRTLA